jgi:hypothetical protein
MILLSICCAPHQNAENKKGRQAQVLASQRVTKRGGRDSNAQPSERQSGT